MAGIKFNNNFYTATSYCDTLTLNGDTVSRQRQAGITFCNGLVVTPCRKLLTYAVETNTTLVTELIEL